MDSNVGDFIKQVEGAKDMVVARSLEFFKTLAQTSYSMISADSRNVGLAYGSPVLTGRYRGSHTIAINTIDKSVRPPAEDPDDEGTIRAKPASEVRAAIETIKLGDKINIANALPYARRIEFGHSKLKAPEGVYEVTKDAVAYRFRRVNAANVLSSNGNAKKAPVGGLGVQQ